MRLCSHSGPNLIPPVWPRSDCLFFNDSVNNTNDKEFDLFKSNLGHFYRMALNQTQIRFAEMWPQSEETCDENSLRLLHHCRSTFVSVAFVILNFLMKRVPLKPFTTRPHHPRLRLCVHALLCAEVAAVASQTAIIAVNILLPFVLLPLAYFKNCLLPGAQQLKNETVKAHIGGLHDPGCCVWHHVDLLRMWVALGL